MVHLGGMKWLGEYVSSVQLRRDMFRKDDLFSGFFLDPVVTVVNVLCLFGDLVRRANCTKCQGVVSEETHPKLLNRSKFGV